MAHTTLPIAAQAPADPHAVTERDQWTPPVVCGMESGTDGSVLVILDPCTRGVSAVRCFAGAFDLDLVEDYLQLMSHRFFASFACAVDRFTAPPPIHEGRPNSALCQWIRYADGPARQYYPEDTLGPWHEDPKVRSHRVLQDKALALARTLQADVDALEQLHQEFYYLSFIQESLRHLRDILTARFPPDLRAAAFTQHGIYF